MNVITESKVWNDIFKRDRRRESEASEAEVDAQNRAREFLEWIERPAGLRHLAFLEGEAMQPLQLGSDGLTEQAVRCNTYRELLKKLRDEERRAKQMLGVE